MKKIIILTGVTISLLGFGFAQASSGSLTNKCKACHKVDKNATGPSFKNIQAAYVDAETLAKALEDGFATEDRAIAGDEKNSNYKKYHKKSKMMTSQYKRLILKKVEAGKFTYKELADEVFSK